MKKVIVIDVKTQTLRYDTAANYKDLQRLVGPECNYITAPIELEHRDTIYCDDEALYNTIEGGFMMKGWDYALTGNGVVQGCNNRGEGVDVVTTIEELAPKIIWKTKAEQEAFAERYL